jgi:hypothetical protein
MDNLKKNDSSDQKKNDKMVETTNHELKEYFHDANLVFGNQQKRWKYSEIFHDFMHPIINEVIHDKKSLIIMLDWGQFVWNKAVAEDFPDNPKSKLIETQFPLFIGKHPDKILFSEFIMRKKEFFGDKNFFIVKQTSLLEVKGRLAISVAVHDLDDCDLSK